MTSPAALDREAAVLSLRMQVEIHSHRQRRKAGRRMDAFDFDDMRSEAWLGAIYAVDRFDASRGFKLSTFADRQIIGRILDWQRRQDPRSRRERKEIKAGRAEDTPRILQLRDTGSRPFIRRPADPTVAIDVRRLLGLLGEKHRRVLTLYYLEERELKEIGRGMGVGVGRVSQIKTEAIGMLRKILGVTK